MAKAPEKADKAARIERRKKRRETEAKKNKVALILDTDVRKMLASQARDAGMTMAQFVSKILENHVMDTAASDDPQAERLRARRAVLDHAVSLARHTDASGEFDEHLILKVMKKASQDADFMAAYETATGGEGRAAQRNKAALNQQLGRLIKQAISARSKRDEAGRIQRAQVQDEIVSSYTLLEKAA